MIILFWNNRGIGGLGRRKQLKELMAKHRVDVICLQETIKQDFSIQELKALGGNLIFSWNWTEAVGM